MPPSSPARTGSRRRAASVGLAAALAIAVVVAPPSSSSMAASPGISKVLDEAKQGNYNVSENSFPAGSQVVYTVAVSCNDDGGDPTCAGFELIDPAPTYTDIDGQPAAMSFVSASAGATALSVSPGPPPTITFDDPLAAGATVNVDLTYQIPAWVTPDNTTLTNVATWGPTTGGEASSLPVEVVARAKAAWNTNKSGPGSLNINETGTYTVSLCATSPNDPDFGPLRATLQNAQLVDELPAAPSGTTLQISNISGGGVYDINGGTNGTITWNLGDLTLAGGCASETYAVSYVSASPIAAATQVTNTLTASGTPDEVDYDFDTTATHTMTVKNPDPGDPTISKSATRSVVDLDRTDGDNDTDFQWQISPRNTAGEGPVFNLTVTDAIPEHYLVQGIQTGTWSSAVTGWDNSSGDARYTFTRDSGAIEVYDHDGVGNVAYNLTDFDTDPLVSIEVEFGTVQDGWQMGQPIRLVGYPVDPGRDGGTFDLAANRTATITNTATVTGDVVDAFGDPSSVTRNATSNVTVVAPQPAPTISKSSSIVAGPSSGGDAYPGATLRWTITVQNPTNTATEVYPDPSIYDLVPEPTGVSLGTPTNFQVTAPAGLTLTETTPGDDVTDTSGNIGGEQLLVWDFTGDLARGGTITVSFDTDVLDNTPPQTITNRTWTGTDALDESIGEWYSSFSNGSGTWEADTLDLDGDTDTTERVRRNNASMDIADFVVASSQKTVAGPVLEASDPACPQLDVGEDYTDNDTYGDGRCTRPGDRIDYRLTIVNDGNVGLDELVLIDVFPRPGDTLVLPSQSDGTVNGRGPGGAGSDFAPNLTGPVTSADPNVVVEYTTVDEPCRGADFYPQLSPTSDSWPAGCQAPNWSQTLPVPITSVRAIRVTYDGVLGVAESFTFEWPMRAPVTTQIGEIAYNAFAWSASSVDSAARNQSAPPVVAVEVNDLPKPWELGDVVWYDDDYDGVQDAGETDGVEGVPVALFFDNDDNGSFTPGIDTLVANTVTDTGANAGEYLFNNLSNGRYFVIVASPTDWVASPRNQGGNDASDSDFGFLGAVGTDITVGELDGWDPTAISPALYDHVFVSDAVVIADDNRLDVDFGLWQPEVSIDVEKATNGADEDVAPGIHIPTGQTVVWTYDVTNTSDVELRNLALTDTTTAGTNVAITVTCDDTTLAAGASTMCAATVPSNATAQVGQYSNNVVATADPVLPTIEHPASSYDNLLRTDGNDFYDAQGDPVPITDSAPSNYFGAQPGIELTKFVEGQDADSAPGVFVPQGDTVDWLITVENTGNVDLEITHIDDDVFGVFGDDGDAQTPNGSCDGGTITFPITLPPGQSRTCTLSEASVYGQHTNVASVSGLPVDDAGDPIAEFDEFGVPTGTTMDPVTASDPANYYGTVSPSIDIEKATAGTAPNGDTITPTDSDSATGESHLAGTAVNWVFMIENDGNADLEITHFTDDVLGVFGDDGDAQTPNGTCDSGTMTFPMTLAPGESRDCTVVGVAVVGQYANVGDVTGTPVDDQGQEITEQESPQGTVSVVPVSDSDPSHYNGVLDAAIDLDTTTSGNLVAAGTGVVSVVGPGDGIAVTANEDATWHYGISNAGPVDLTDVILVDDAGTPGDDTDDITITVNAGSIDVTGYDPTAVELTGDTDDDGILSVGETWNVTIATTSLLGTYSNDAAVSAQPIDIAGDPILELVDDELVAVDRVTADDPTSHTGAIDPQIGLDTTTSGDYVDLATGTVTLVGPGDGVELTAGGDATWHYEITNPGDTDLADVVLVDDAGTPGDGTDDITITVNAGSIDVTGYDPTAVELTGDTDDDGILSIGETWTVTIDFTSELGTYDNDATVTGQPVTTGGDPIVDTVGDDVPRVSADDPTSYEATADPAIALVKYTNGEDAKTPTGPFVLAGGTVTWTFDVTNTGPTALLGAVGTDPSLDTDPICTIPLLLPGETETCSIGGDRLGSGQQTNTASVTADPGAPTGQFDPADPETWPTEPDDYVVLTIDGEPVAPVTDTDVSHHYGADPSISIEKATNGEDADTAAEAVAVVVGSTVTWTFEVTNTGNTDLVGVAVTDTDLGTDDTVAVTCPSSTLEPGESMTCAATGTAVDADHVNLATVTGQPVDGADEPVGETVTDDDPSHYRPVESDLRLVKTLAGGVTNGVITSGELRWQLVVTNLGPDPATDVVVTDELPSSLQYAGFSGPANCTIQGSVVTCNVIGTLDVGDTVTITIDTLLLGRPSEVSNTASVGSSSIDRVTPNDDDSAGATVMLPELPRTGSAGWRDVLLLASLLAILGGAVHLSTRRRRTT